LTSPNDTYTRAHVTTVVNKAVDDLTTALNWSGDEADTANLFVNVILHRMDEPDDTIEEAVEEMYDLPAAEVLGWAT
jgi:hypothetical protein